MNALEEFRSCYRERDKAARQWKKSGRKVVGYIAANAPEELISAAGFLPYRLSGDPESGYDLLRKYVFPIAPMWSTGANQLKIEFVNSVLQLLFSGRYDFVDYLVVPNARKSILSIHAHLRDAKAVYPDLKVPESCMLDRTITDLFDSAIYNREQIVSLKEQLEAWSGRGIDDAAITGEIARGNAHRALLKKVVELRVADGARLSGVDALAIFGSAKFMPREQHMALLDKLLADTTALKPRPGKRIFVAGSPLDNARLYELIEACGATVVGENHYWGESTSEYPLRTDVAPLHAVADHHHKVPSDVVYPLARAIEACARRATAAKPDGAIFNVYGFDDHQGWETPDQMAALRAAGIPSLYLKDQPYRIAAPDELKAQIGAFIATL
jgi:benzoyl-CoA reductase/2-hydroxyglutaryl-CoA dehydratase subunit BcrC/BadD/HgdB